MSEYTQEEIGRNGNQMYGGKRHDEICDKLQVDYGFSEAEINNISMGVWKGIESERNVANDKIKSLEAELSEARLVIEFYGDHKNYSITRHSYFETYFAEIKNDHSIIKITEADGDKFILPFGGSRAREFLAKHPVAP